MQILMLFKELKKLWSEKDLKTVIVHVFLSFIDSINCFFYSSFYINLKDREYSVDLPYYFLVLGRDEDLDNTFRTDVIILAGLNKGRSFFFQYLEI